MTELKIEPLGSPAYPIYLDTGWDLLADRLKASGPEYRRICLVTDSQVAPLYREEVGRTLAFYGAELFDFEIPAGEEHKTLTQIQKLYTFLIEHHFDRHDLLAALGGGVIGDMTGFAAATYLRGIDFIQLPTTLLSQVDSSIGGKTGVDVSCYKNMVGAFKQPRLVYMNLSALRTLPPRQLSSGMAEVIKHGCIRNADYFARLRSLSAEVSAFRPEALRYLVEESLRIKKSIVEADPLEKGERALLNFGHTLGHALEKESGFTLTHGESVALGCVAAGYLSCRKHWLSSRELEAMEETFAVYSLPTRYSDFHTEKILQAVRHDKKMAGDTLRFILLNPLGRAEICRSVTPEEMTDALLYLSKENSQ